MNYTIEKLSQLRESEDRIEFKSAQHNFSFAGSNHSEQAEKRKCYLGYIVGLCNEGGGILVLGMSNDPPHKVVGSDFAQGEIGKLEDEVYRRLQIRVHIEEHFNDKDLRVVVTYIPSRPRGRLMKFEGVPLMRTGESLRNMSDEEVYSVLSEQEPDFSATICHHLTIDDLDEKAISILKARYSEKQNNKAFLNQSTEQVLIDLDLLKDGQLTYASLILLGKKEKIKEYLPQNAIHLEYRSNPGKIQFDKRDQFMDPYFVLIEDLWKTIDARNKLKHIQIDSYIIDIPELNHEIIRESINNAVAHRDYSKTSEIIIKQSNEEFTISSHGGFPLGVTKENILTINSTPRNRLLADALTKTGLVERSGQGVDKIFYQNLTEGKGFPDYEDSDLFQVTLKIPIQILHPVFALFVRDIQKGLLDYEKLGVQDIITLTKIRDKNDLSIEDRSSIVKLKEVESIRETGERIILAQHYTELSRDLEGSDRNKIIEFIKESGKVKMGDVVALFDNRLTRRQVNNMIFKLVEENVLKQKGSGAATLYVINPKIDKHRSTPRK